MQYVLLITTYKGKRDFVISSVATYKWEIAE